LSGGKSLPMLLLVHGVAAVAVCVAASGAAATAAAAATATTDGLLARRPQLGVLCAHS